MERRSVKKKVTTGMVLTVLLFGTMALGLSVQSVDGGQFKDQYGETMTLSLPGKRLAENFCSLWGDNITITIWNYQGPQYRQFYLYISHGQYYEKDDNFTDSLGYETTMTSGRVIVLWFIAPPQDSFSIYADFYDDNTPVSVNIKVTREPSSYSPHYEYSEHIEKQTKELRENITTLFSALGDNITMLSTTLSDNVTLIYSSLDVLQLYLEERMNDTEIDVALKYQWVMENISMALTGLGELGNTISMSFTTLLYKYQWAMDNITALSLQDNEIRNELKDNATVLQESITRLQSLLLILESQVHDVCDSINETIVSMGVDLVDLEFGVETEFDVLHEGVVHIYNNLQILRDELSSQIDDVNSEVADIWDWNNKSLNHTLQVYNDELDALDDREWENNAANVQEFQSAQLKLREAQEDIEKAQDDIENVMVEAECARNIGIGVGSIGIFLAIIAIIIGSRRPTRIRYRKEPPGE